MSADKEFLDIKKTVNEHEKRIKELEKLVIGKVEKVIIKRKTIIDHLIYLKNEGFFDQPKSVREIVEALAKGGYHYAPESLTHPLQRVTRNGILGRIKKEKKWAYCKR